MSPQFQQGFYDAVETYVRSRDPRAFSNTLTEAMSRQPPAK
jgi:glucose/mannose transport system substrate-binding protein